MKKISAFISFAILGVIVSQTGQAQLRKIPSAVKEAFNRQYPQARNVQYEDKLIFVQVYFQQSDSASTAKYNAKGIWEWTETAMPFNSLPQAVQDGFNKSKYADWQVDHIYKVDYPGNVIRYKIQVEKSAIQKRNLFYSEKGRMISDNLTLY